MKPAGQLRSGGRRVLLLAPCFVENPMNEQLIGASIRGFYDRRIISPKRTVYAYASLNVSAAVLEAERTIWTN